MTLRLTEEETAALKACAEAEGRSMQEVARQAVRDYVHLSTQAEQLERILDAELPRYRDALDRLGQ